MLRPGNIVGAAVGGLVGYLCSFDIDTSLGAAKPPVYVGIGAVYGWMTGFVFHTPPAGGVSPGDRDAELAAAVARAEAAEADGRRLRERVAELEGGR